MRYLVTGAAGFIGSHLCERLLALGHDVTGVDAFIPYYPQFLKERNIADASANERFRFLNIDLREDKLDDAVDGAEVVFHLAAMPGLVASWTDFDLYLSCNVTATQRLLEAVKGSGTLKRFVYGSTSSAYGISATGDETMPTRPVSPYGVTKLAGEHLAHAHRQTFGLPAVVLRFFSVYGPRQRPDMAYNVFIDALLKDKPITVYGDGEQVRGNTFVADCVEGVIAAQDAAVGETFNIGGSETASLNDVLRRLERIAGKKFQVEHAPARPGDQRETFADTTKLRRELGWSPKTTLDDGLAAQFEWQRGM